jgi:catechol 2,3-dioxygenase-like lactoylglutathione lyase family enzyme
MKPIISDLVQRYESGRLSRRDLIQGLTMLAAVGPAAAADLAPDSGLIASGIDHVSVLVSDLQRSVAFYQSLFGLSVLSEDKPHNIVRLGRKRVIVSLRTEAPQGTIDHFGVTVENFDKSAVTRVLKQRGLEPQENWQYGFHVKDPDGAVVQFV